MLAKTNATRILDRLDIPYEILEYAVDDDDLGAEHVARQLSITVDQTVKTLVVRGDRTGVFVCCLNGNREIDLKVLAAETGNRKVETIPAQQLQSLTGYIRGGVSPIGMKKNFKILIDSKVLLEEKISMSAGKRGLQIWLSPDDLLKATGAEIKVFSREKT